MDADDTHQFRVTIIDDNNGKHEFQPEYGANMEMPDDPKEACLEVKWDMPNDVSPGSSHMVITDGSGQTVAGRISSIDQTYSKEYVEIDLTDDTGYSGGKPVQSPGLPSLGGSGRP